MNASKQVVAAYGAGALRPHELQETMQAAWIEVIEDPGRRDEVARLFRLPPETVEHMREAPLVFEPPRSGMGAAEVAVIVSTWVGTEVLLGAVKDLAKQQVKEALQRLWTDILLPAWRKRVPARGALGQEKNLSEGG